MHYKPVLESQDHLTGLTRSHDNFIFIMGIPVPGKIVLCVNWPVLTICFDS